MKSVLYALAIFGIGATAFAQTGPAGTWRVEGVGPSFPWEAVLRVDGPELIGAVRSCASVFASF